MIEVQFAQTLAAIRAQMHDAGFAEAWAGGRALSLDDSLALALDGEQ